jgi:transketolase
VDTLTGLDEVRRLLELETGDEKHDPASTSTLDVLWVLYDRILRVDPERPTWEARDRFVLSKGHGPTSYYAILAAKGFIPVDELRRFMTYEGRLGAHPDRQLVPGVEASTGSLGHGLPMAVGIAVGLRAKGALDQRVVVLVGDAELNEGSNWEAILLAPSLGLGSLTLVVIDNHSSSIPMTPWEQRLGSFGWDVTVVDGHDHDALERALSKRLPDRPVAVVADVEGCG